MSCVGGNGNKYFMLDHDHDGEQGGRRHKVDCQTRQKSSEISFSFDPSF